LYHRQRPKEEMHGKEHTYVTWKDMVRGLVVNRKFVNNMIQGRIESAMDAYGLIQDNVEADSRSYDELDNAEEIDGDSFTNMDVKRWMGVEKKTADEYTRKLDEWKLIYKDASTKPHRHYVVDTKKSETAGITLRTLYDIIESVFEREELGEWAKQHCDLTDIEEGEEDVVDKVGFSKDDLPIELDVGLESVQSFRDPLYMKFSQWSINEPTTVKLEMKDGVISCGFGSVSEEFSGGINGDSEEPDSDDDSEPGEDDGGQDQDQEENEDDYVDSVPDKHEIKDRVEKIQNRIDGNKVPIPKIQEFFRETYGDRDRVNQVLDPENSDAGIGHLIHEGKLIEDQNRVLPL